MCTQIFVDQKFLVLYPTVKKKSGTYLALVESYREKGKVKQRVKKYLGKEINGKPVRRVRTSDIGVEFDQPIGAYF